MTCHTFQSLLRLNDVLPVSAIRPVARRLEAHSETCAACSAYRRSYTAVPELLHRTHEALLTQCAVPWTGQSPRRGRGRWARYAAWAGLSLGGAAVAALLLAAGHVQSRRSIPDGRPAEAGRPVPRLRSTDARAPALRGPASRAPGGPGPHPAHAAPSDERQPRLPAAGPGVRKLVTASGWRRRSPALVPDVIFLDGRDPCLMADWMAGSAAARQVRDWARRRLPAVRDDFVRIRLPQLATADLKSPAAAEAARQYEKEARVVDSRLFRKVTLALKAASLEDLCAEMSRQTGVALRASRGTADEKVTVFVDERPAREVMREVARLFGFFWGRVGEEGSYKYDLEQDLRAQLAEEEMRRRDLDAALLQLDDTMGRFRPYVNLDLKELEAAAARAKGPEKERIQQFLNKRAPILVYHHLSPADRAGLLNGQMVRFVRDSADPDHRLPQEWYPYGAADGQIEGGAGGPGAKPFVGLSIDRSEAGELRLLVSEGGATEGGPGGGTWGGVTSLVPLATGKSPSTADPQNAVLNRPLRASPAFLHAVSFEAKPSCPWFQPDELGKHPAPAPTPEDEINGIREPHVTSADVWEAIHRASHMDIVADAYSRYYPAASFSCRNVPLFDALCRAGDTLGARWHKDGDYLLCRSTGFFWDKLKEVPNRFLKRWSADRGRGPLALDDLLEMSTLSDTQLNSETSGKVIEHCWGLDEWANVGRGFFREGIDCSELRPYARFYASLSEPQRRLAETRGVGADDLLPAQADALRRLLEAKGPGLPRGARLRVDYAPAGAYVWAPHADLRERSALPVAWGRTADEALAAARKIRPDLPPDQVHQSRGLFGVTQLLDGIAGWQLRYEGVK